MIARLVLKLRPSPSPLPFPSRIRRSFFSLPRTGVTTLSETRILPYMHTSLYTLIADVDSYSSFLPYCQESRVTEWSTRDGTRWPAKADLLVGWGGYQETFTSRLICIPNSVVEAVGGNTSAKFAWADSSHHSAPVHTPHTTSHIFRTLSTLWTVKPFQRQASSPQALSGEAVIPAMDETEVKLTIEFEFSNPLYDALSKAVAPQIASIMIEAFEKRALRLLGS